MPLVAYLLAMLPYLVWADISIFDLGDIALVLTGYALIGFVPVGLAKVQRQSLNQASELALRNAELERLRAIEVDQAVSAERNRIARDLHDVVAHHISAIALRASGAARLTSTTTSTSISDTEQQTIARQAVWEALDVIKSSSTDALTAMRAMVGALRAPDDRAPLGSQPSLGELDSLVDQAQCNGFSVDLRTTGNAESLAPTLQVCLYRLIQESLTNVTKHSNAQHVNITIELNHSRVELSVSDDGHPTKSSQVDLSSQNQTGYGILGMKERVALLGGELVAGPGRQGGWQGGWQVKATLAIQTIEKPIDK